jgi:hypothetical protein
MILAFLTFSSNINTIESTRHYLLRREAKSLDVPKDRTDRNLETLACSFGAGPDNYFMIRIDITPRGGANLGSCSSELQKSLGALINVVLDDFGFGEAGIGDNAVFSADVCEVPTLSGRRLPGGFSWSGGGVCKSCGADNGDGRRLNKDEEDKDDDETWFPEIYAPKLKKMLKKGISKSLPSSSSSCLGSSPNVNVNIQHVTVKPGMSCGHN